MMDTDKTFHQRWEFRRKDDSLSDDSKSSSGDEPVGKKHKLVPTLSSSENDEVNDIQIPQQKSQVIPRLQIAKDKKQIEPGKKRNGTDQKSRRNSGEKRKRKVNHPNLDQDPALVGDLKIFTASLLEDLKVARKKMFVQMRKQITKMLTAKPDRAMHHSVKKSGRKTQTGLELLPKGAKRNNRQRRSNGKFKVAADKGEARSTPAKKPLPTVLPKPQTEILSSDSSWCDAINHRSYSFEIHPAEQFGNLDQITPKSMRFLNQQSSQISCMLSALPAPLQEWSNNGFNLASQNVAEDSAAEQENNSARMRINDGAVWGLLRETRLGQNARSLTP